jgi:hypothetical protein
MENRSFRYESGLESALGETSTDETVRESSLSEAELHSLVDFFQMLDRWERQLVQNVHAGNEVRVCSVQ